MIAYTKIHPHCDRTEINRPGDDCSPLYFYGNCWQCNQILLSFSTHWSMTIPILFNQNNKLKIVQRLCMYFLTFHILYVYGFIKNILWIFGMKNAQSREITFWTFFEFDLCFFVIFNTFLMNNKIKTVFVSK